MSFAEGAANQNLYLLCVRNRPISMAITYFTPSNIYKHREEKAASRPANNGPTWSTLSRRVASLAPCLCLIFLKIIH